jgi:hypothetical protein
VVVLGKWLQGRKGFEWKIVVKKERFEMEKL